MQVFTALMLLVCFGSVCAWDNDELEVFDVVDEVNQNFYTLLDIPRDADAGAIKKAFRRLSLVLHPDKNDSPDAEVQFRQLVAVYDVLKDPNKRKCYDNVLENGLPDWKHAVYYYRRVRRMGLPEMTVILFIIITIGQYLWGWASYFERKLTVEEYLNTKTKKSQKKQKKGKPEGASTILLEELDSVLVKPSIKDTLPCQIPRALWFLFVTGPPLLVRTVRDFWHERQLRKQQELEQQEEEEEEVEVIQRAPRKRKTFVLPELTDDPSVEVIKPKTIPKPSSPPVISGGFWSDDDLLDLAKLVKKYPVGTTERWEKIGEAMNRPASEVAHMAHKLNENLLKSLQQKENKEEEDKDAEGDEPLVEEPRKVKTRGGKVGDVSENSIGNWTQVQQKALETALAKFPKGAANDRWVKIAKCVPGKTKEECMLRYKYLVDMLKKKKEHIDPDSGGEMPTEGTEDSSLANHQDITITASEHAQQNGDSIT